MSRIRLRLPKVEPTPEEAYLNRRRFIQQAGLGAAGLGVLGPAALARARGGSEEVPEAITRPSVERPEILELFPAQRNAAYPLPREQDELTPKLPVLTYNNYYEFTTDKLSVWRLAQDFETDPWTVEVTGECHNPRTFDIDDLFRGFDQEERTYRFRCVEAWAMDVPWTGFALHKLLEKVEPKANAKYVKFETVHRPNAMPGQSRSRMTRHYPWPYTEGLRMNEAMNELTLGCTGLYGKPLTRQNGGPFRIIVPWKYGYKSPKAVVRIELTEQQPATLWETLHPDEYPFESNVEPEVPHPRWSQADERVIPTNDRRPTLYLNGYAEHVAHLYE